MFRLDRGDTRNWPVEMECQCSQITRSGGNWILSGVVIFTQQCNAVSSVPRRISFISVSVAVQLFAAGVASAPSGYLPVDPSRYLSFREVPRYRGFLPEAVDLSNKFPTPGTQGKLQSCTGWAVGYAARSYYSHTIEKRQLNHPRDTPSPSYIFNVIRPSDGCENGAYLPDALQLLLTKGSLSIFQYPDLETCKRPLKVHIQAAVDFRIDNWLRFNLLAIDDMKSQLAKGDPIIIGMSVDTTFDQVRGSDVYAGRQAQSYPHAMTIVGYDERKQGFKVINSWGTSWGDGGFGWIAYEAFLRDGKEAYVMKVQPPTPSEPEIATPTPPIPKPAPRIEPVQPSPKVVEPIPLKPTPNIVEPLTPPDLSKKCSRLSFKREIQQTLISGFVGTKDELEQIRKSYSGSQYKIDVQLRPWPQCEVLMTLDKALTAVDGPVVKTHRSNVLFKAKEPIVFGVKTPARPSFIYISYIQADGSVMHLEQPSWPMTVPTLSRSDYNLGDGLEGRARFTASPPFGREMVVVLAAASPLFEQPLPKQQTEREYLSALRKALLYKADPKLPERIVSAAFLGLETLER
jgi:hypothetical protein